VTKVEITYYQKFDLLKEWIAFVDKIMTFKYQDE